VISETIDGARPAEMPGFIKPQLATLKSRAPKGDQWLREIKYDGYRLQIHLNGGRRKVYSRNGLDWTKRFSVISGALDIPGQAIIDGEVVVIKDGRTNFSEFQAELAKGDQDRLVFYAFDLLWRDGDLRKLPQIERKHALLDLLAENGIEAPIVYSEHLTGDGQEMFEHAASVVSKNAEAPYRSGRSEAWLKIKTSQRGKFPVVGFVKDPTKHIVNQKAGHFQPDKFEDQYEAALLQLINSKRAGKPVAAKARPRGENVVDLMDARRKSIGGDKATATEAPTKSAKKPRKAAAGQKEMLMPIAGKKPKETANKKPAAKPQRKSA
jgi:hypothetical protein